jgi:hypothetical protein
LFKENFSETDPTLIYHHLGLGDYIIISGGLKYLRKEGMLGKAFLVCKHQYLNSVKQLYADVEGFEIIGVNDWKGAEVLVEQWKGRKMIIGFDKMVDWCYFDKDFYRIMKVDFKERWESFAIKRDADTESLLLRDLRLPEEFVFLHDDSERGFKINTGHLKADLPVVRPSLTNSIFDWIAVLERATEIHCICSSFKHLVYYLHNIKAELFYHYSYVNNGAPREDSITSSKKNWQII